MSEKVEEVEGVNEPTVEEQLLNNIEKLSNKESKFYFFTMDTKGNPTAAVANIYEHVKVLRELGYDASILHEKNDYQSVGSWLGEEYAGLPHTSIEDQQLKVNGYDFVIIPEIFANVMEQTAGLPCKRIVLSQSYDYILEMMMPGKKWQDFNIDTVLTTSERQGEYIQQLFGGGLKVAVTPLSIPSYFKPSTKPKKPIIAIYTRDQRDTVKIFKTFYLKHPHLKWVSFRDMRSMSRENFAESLSECCLAIWVDDISGFGTFPLEAMKCNVPVLGKVPTIVPEWMEDKNGLWTHDLLAIPDLTANFVQAWLEDMAPEELYEKMGEMKDKYTETEQRETLQKVYEALVSERIAEFERHLPKEEVVEDNTTNENEE
jgi:hypothetical protein